jgi:hypothetical protein
MGADGEARLSAGRAQRMEGRCISTSRLARNGDRGNLRRLQRKREAPRRYKASSDSSAFFRGYIQSGSSFDSCDVHKRKMPTPRSLTVIARLGIAPWQGRVIGLTGMYSGMSDFATRHCPISRLTSRYGQGDGTRGRAGRMYVSECFFLRGGPTESATCR